jgi:hypothetical protein
MNSKERYRVFCRQEDLLPVFFQPWWLDAVSEGGNWDVLLYEKNDEILAVYPFFFKRKYIAYRIITMPPFTPFLGPYLLLRKGMKNHEIYSFQKEALNFFISNLPKCDYIVQFFNYELQNWLPFYWNKYSQSTFYSYLINDISDPEKVRAGFHPNKQSELRRASLSAQIKDNLSPEEFYNFHRSSLNKVGHKISYSFEQFMRIYQAAMLNNSGKIFYSFDGEKMNSALFFIWDKRSGYNLITVNDPEYRKLGTLSLLIYEAINYLSDKTKMYDLEGSMNENYEFSYRQFGGNQQPYLMITKTYSQVIKLWQFLNPPV